MILNSLNKFILNYKKEFFLYILAGGFCALINWSGFYFFNTNLNINYILAGIYAFIISTSINFLLCKIIFKSKGIKKRIEFLLVLLASFIAIIIDLSIMTIFIKFLNIIPIFGKILGTGFAFIFNYTFRQFFIFEKNN